jgi:hypothetical protein
MKGALMGVQSDAQTRLLEAITKNVSDLEAEAGVDSLQRAASLERLALAYRYAAGGAQPGGVTVTVAK